MYGVMDMNTPRRLAYALRVRKSLKQRDWLVGNNPLRVSERRTPVTGISPIFSRAKREGRL